MVPYLFPQHEIDVPGSLGGGNDNCCHADVSLSVRLLIFWCVRYPLLDSVPCSLYMFDVMVAYRESPRQAVEPHWRKMVSLLLHLFSSLAYRWLCIRLTSSNPHHKRVILARISMGSHMWNHMNWLLALLVIMVRRVTQRNVSCDGKGHVSSISGIIIKLFGSVLVIKGENLSNNALALPVRVRDCRWEQPKVGYEQTLLSVGLMEVDRRVWKSSIHFIK